MSNDFVLFDSVLGFNIRESEKWPVAYVRNSNINIFFRLIWYTTASLGDKPLGGNLYQIKVLIWSWLCCTYIVLTNLFLLKGIQTICSSLGSRSRLNKKFKAGDANYLPADDQPCIFGCPLSHIYPINHKIIDNWKQEYKKSSNKRFALWIWNTPLRIPNTACDSVNNFYSNTYQLFSARTQPRCTSRTPPSPSRTSWAMSGTASRSPWLSSTMQGENGENG